MKNYKLPIIDIPKGNYCYTVIDNDFNIIDEIPIKLCPYWVRTNSGAKCNLLNKESIKGDILLIWDQVKECGINLE
jgi:hypothetical protein